MSLLTSDECLRLYGQPEKESFMTVWTVPPELELGFIPKKIYCNRDLVAPLHQALQNVVDRGLVSDIRSWDGCFNIRQKRAASTMSLHSWGLAVDINAAWNRFGGTPSMSPGLVACFKDAGFDWGGDWSHPDGMHFQLQAAKLN